MKTLLSTIALILTTLSSTFAQELRSPLHIGFIFPISSNGVMAKDYTNDVSLHVIAGMSKSEKAFCASGIANMIMEDAEGMQAAGFANFIHDSARGAQLAGFMNYVNNHAEGVQAAGFMNLTGSAEGAQLAGFGNISIRQADGAQLAGFINIAERTDMQGAGFINIAEQVKGPQLAGFANIGEKVEGAQAAGFINVAGETPVQAAGFANVAIEANTQIAGFVNVAGKVKGAQIAGFMNIADSCEYPIGLINIIRNGEKHMGVTVDESMTTIAALRSGSRRLYGIIGAGYNFRYSGNTLYALEAGFGAHLPISKNFRLNLEASCTGLSDMWNYANMKSTLRVLPAIKLGSNVEIFAGPTINMMIYDNSYSGEDIVPSYLWSDWSKGNFYGFYVGGVAGVQLKF
ncbi:MAG: hypothetical protein EOP56_00555 [Sphingobacteriales bacterium]|nr:MAG: hypothetical protein EOP56_00555 [Sphingobacteriales bacterium]